MAFFEYKWLEYADAVRKVASKREKTMLRQANKELKKWEKEKALKEKKAHIARSKRLI